MKSRYFLPVWFLVCGLILVFRPAGGATAGIKPVIAGGYDHSLGIKADGSLWAWGWNAYGALGLGDTNEHDSPVQVGPGFVSVAGWQHSLGLKADGSLWAWGYNYSGQLGLGDRTDRHTPTQVPGSWWNSPLVDIFASAGAGGAISPSGLAIVTSGSNQTFNITPNKGYRVAAVLVDNVSIGPVRSYTFTGVTANHTIQAIFKKTSVSQLFLILWN